MIIVIQIIYFLLLFVLPFVINPFGSAFYETPKVILAEVLIEILMVVWLLGSKRSFKLNFLIPLGVLFLVSILGLIFFPSSTVFFGNQFRLQGTFLLWHLLIFSLISSQIELKIPQQLLYLLLPVLLLVTVLMGTESNGRAIGTLGEPNALAAVAVFLWPFAWFGEVKKIKQKVIVKTLMLGVALSVVFFSGSRSGFVALLIQTIFLLSFKLRRNLQLSLILAFILFLFSLSLPFVQTSSGFKFEDRPEVWKVALQTASQSPILGQGFGNIEQVFKPTARRLNSDLQYQYVDSAHNIFLDFWIEGGLIGLGILGFLVTNSFKNFLQQQKMLPIVLMTGMVVVLSFNPASVVALIALWWLIGQGFKTYS